MIIKFLGSYPPKITTFILIDHHLIICRLASIELPRRMHGSRSDGMHIRFRDMPSNNRNSILPNKQFLIIRATNEFILLDEGESIDRSQMLGILH
jgi:hypothetical protein